MDCTLVLFLSDNGGCHEEIHSKSRRIEDLGSDESFESYGRPWANYSNVPFREYKSWTHEGNRAVRLGQWKLVAKGIEGKWELYDTSADRTELTDLSAEQPDRVEEMAATWRQYAERTYVLPLDDRAWSERIDDPLRLGPPNRS